MDDLTLRTTAALALSAAILATVVGTDPATDRILAPGRITGHTAPAATGGEPDDV